MPKNINILLTPTQCLFRKWTTHEFSSIPSGSCVSVIHFTTQSVGWLSCQTCIPWDHIITFQSTLQWQWTTSPIWRRKRFRVFQSFNLSSALVVQFFLSHPSPPETLLLSQILKTTGWCFPLGQKNNRFPDVWSSPTTAIRSVPPVSLTYSHIKKRNDLISHWITDTHEPNQTY